jgi:hypothetical protein
MLDRLVKLPGNLLRDLVGVLPHDDPATGNTSGYGEGHFKEWCESMGGKVVGPGMCSFNVEEAQYKDIHNQIYKGTENQPMRSDFIEKYNAYMQQGSQ